MSSSLEAAWEALTRTDDLLGDILIRLPTLADHGRACAAYAAFRRVITSPAFLHRLHARHPPSLLGFRTFKGRFRPVDSAPPSAHALAEAADFRFSFLPDPALWVIRDARDGRFLLDRNERGDDGTFTTVVVCDPLFFKRYIILSQIPRDLAATVQETPHPLQPHVGIGIRRNEIFLAPCDNTEEDQQKSFRVVWIAQCRTKIVAFVFSSASGQWTRAIASPSRTDLNPAMLPVAERQWLCSRNYAHGRFYWLATYSSRFNLVVLDMARTEFYHISPLSRHRHWEFAMVELGDNRRGMFAFAPRIHVVESSVLQLFSADRQDHGVGAGEWMLENEVSLSSSYDYTLLGDADGKLIIQRRHRTSEPEFSCI